MNMENRRIEELIRRYPVLQQVQDSIVSVYQIMQNCFEQGGKLLIAGNGGSCADAEHIVGELMKGFEKKRPLPDGLKEELVRVNPVLGEQLAERLQRSLPAIALTGHPALSTAFLNDVSGAMTYAQQVCGYGCEKDVFLGISTSGNAENIEYALTAARAKGMKTIGLTGKDGGALGRGCDAAVIVPEQETYKIQELHLPIYHTLCLMLEDYFF
ncbi:MAG: D-sedoheptulose-7-phosphate isomerase [Lachnospiraceae bacterium]